jgi:hypothetical protein
MPVAAVADSRAEHRGRGHKSFNNEHGQQRKR